MFLLMKNKNPKIVTKILITIIKLNYHQSLSQTIECCHKMASVAGLGDVLVAIQIRLEC